MVIKPPLIAVVGPTASGKTGLAIGLAEQFRGEIISADSRQVYRGMDVGTDKPDAEQQARVQHHLIDVADPDRFYGLANFQDAALRAIDHVLGRNRLPFLVGGSGLYIQAVVDNLSIPRVPPQPELRRKLDALSLKNLRQRLKEVDPVAYTFVDLQNPRRLIRAIEVTEAGRPFSELRRPGESKYQALQLGIDSPPEELRRRIIERMRRRLQRGIIEEIRRLNEDGVSWEQLEAFGLEYRRYAEFLQGKRTKEEAIELSQKELLAFAKRQMTWFKRDKRIIWIRDEDEAETAVSDWLTVRAGGAT